MAEQPFVERRVRQVPVAHDRRRPAPPPRPARGRTFLYEMVAALVIVVGLVAIALPVYGGYVRRGHDAAAEADVHNAIYSLEVCSALSGTLPTTMIVAGRGTPAFACPGRALETSPGTTLVYLPDPESLSFVLLAHNSGGRPVYWCWNQAVGGSIGVVADAASTC